MFINAMKLFGCDRQIFRLSVLDTYNLHNLSRYSRGCEHYHIWDRYLRSQISLFHGWGLLKIFSVNFVVWRRFDLVKAAAEVIKSFLIWQSSPQLSCANIFNKSNEYQCFDDFEKLQMQWNRLSTPTPAPASQYLNLIKYSAIDCNIAHRTQTDRVRHGFVLQFIAL